MLAAFRVDSAISIGSGHVMRCLILAQELKKQQADILFITKNHLGNLAQMITEMGFNCSVIPCSNIDATSNKVPHSKWLGSNWEWDASQTIESIQEFFNFKKIDWLIIDHYGIDAQWETALHKYCQHILVIDDLADREHACDIIVDQNLYINMQQRYTHLVSSHAQILTGPRYSLLRPEFLEHRTNSKENISAITKFFICFGGVDEPNLTDLSIQAVIQLKIPVYNIDVVIGSQNKNYLSIKNKYSSYQSIKLHFNTSNIALLMQNAELSIGAGGISTWERCCMGLPSICFSIASNQDKQLQDADNYGILLNIGSSKNASVELIANSIRNIISQPILYTALHEKCLRTVDTYGSQRVSFAMKQISSTSRNGLTFRIANVSDADLYFNWANDALVRQFSYNQNQIEYNNHLEWFNEKIRDTNSFLYILMENNIPVGQIRFQINNDSIAWIGFSIDEKFRGHGYAPYILKHGSVFLLSNLKNVNLRICGSVMKTNIASVQSFIKAGFLQIRSSNIDGHPSYIFEWPYYA